MNQTEAENLATMICRTWPDAAHPDAWVDALLELDAGAAGTAYARLRRRHTTAPAIAALMAEAGAIVASRNEPSDQCETCDGTRYVDCEDDRRHRSECVTPDTCGCHAVLPCPECVKARR